MVLQSRADSARRTFMLAGAAGFLCFGAWSPLALVFYTLHMHLPVVGVGTSMTAGTVGGVLASTWAAGHLSDKYGPLRTQSMGALLQAVAEIMVMTPCHSLAVPASVAFVGVVGNTMYFTADTESVRRVARNAQECDKLFGWMASARLVSFGIGAGVGGLVLLLSKRFPSAWYVCIIACAGVLALVALTMWSLRRVDDQWVPYEDAEPCADDPPSYRDVVRQAPFMVFIFGQFSVAVVTLGQNMILALYILSVDLPRWSIPASITLGCVLSGVSPLLATRYASRLGKVRVLIVSSVGMAMGFALILLSGLVGVAAGIAVLLIGMVVFGAADGINAALGQATALSFAPKHLSGRHSSLQALSWTSGSIVAPALYTALLSANHFAPWVFGIAMAGATTVMYGWVRNRVPSGG